MTNIFIKNWQITLLVVILILSISAIAFSGLKLGLDFKGGTLYQIELQKQVGTDEISRIANIISRRIDPSGLMDATVTPVGGQFIAVQVSETDPAKLEQIESRIRQQGKFEATLNGETIFTGDEISRVLRGGSGYGVGKVGNVYEWRLPFVLNETASNSFTQKAFHQCSVTLGSNGKPAYDCAKTIFFLDKPEALVVVSQEQYDADTALLLEGSGLEGIPAGTSLEEVISDSQVPVVIYDQNTIFDTNLLQTTLKKTTLAIVSPDISEKVKNDLNALGFNVSVAALKQNIPWVWGVLNAKQVISLTADVTNEDVADVSQAKPFWNFEY